MSDEDLVVFFRAMTPARRKEYDALAELDRRHGEDLGAEDDGAARKLSKDVS